MIIGLIKEELPERRVALLPEAVMTLVKMSVTVLVERGAGEGAFAGDEAYLNAGARVVDKAELFREAGLFVKINPLTAAELSSMKEQAIFLAAFNPLINVQHVEDLRKSGISSFSLDIIPRTTRAQSMDILSSMATVSGYKAVLTAALTLPKFFPMFMTAAGTITPAKVLILGAGVAGLQAIATSRKLGAVVEVFDVRAAVREEVIGLGAKFVEVEGAVDDKSAGGYAVEQSEEFRQKQANVIHEHAVKSDVIICTAQIPGKKAPVLIRRATVEGMKPGSVIIDLAASTGGNCEVTGDNKTIVHQGVTVIGNSGFPSEMPTDASKMFGKNVINFLKLFFNQKGEFALNWEDDLIRGTCVTHNKEVVNERVKSVIKG